MGRFRREAEVGRGRAPADAGLPGPVVGPGVGGQAGRGLGGHPMSGEIVLDITGALSAAEAAELERCEAVIETGMVAYHEIGAALAAIREGRLYRDKYGTFEKYCQDRWGFTRRRGDQLVGEAE